jgi:hypothetical protein
VTCIQLARDLNDRLAPGTGDIDSDHGL